MPGRWSRSSSRGRRLVVGGRGRGFARVLAGRERVPDRRGMRLRELADRGRADRLLHEQAPDRGREGAARNRDAVHVRHRDLGLGVADPDSSGQRGGDPAEPGVGVVLGGAGLAARGATDVRAHARPRLDVLLEDLRHLVGDPVRDHALALGVAPAAVPVLVAVGVDDLADRHRLGVDPARGEGRVRGRLVEGRDADRAEAHRRDIDALVRLEGRADSEPVRHRRNLVRPEVEREPRVDRVVGEERRVRDRRRAHVRLRVGGNVPRRRVRVGLVVERGREVARRVGIDPFGDGLGEDVRLEGRARLAAGLGREVELVPGAARGDRGHRLDRAAPRVDGDDRRRGVVVVVERVLDRPLGCALHARVDRRVDLEPAGADGLRAVFLYELVTDEAEEVGLADPRVDLAGPQVEISGADRLAVVPVADVAASCRGRAEPGFGGRSRRRGS